MSLVHNERTKLFANALDRASTACFAVGVCGPAHHGDGGGYFALRRLHERSFPPGHPGE